MEVDKERTVRLALIVSLVLIVSISGVVVSLTSVSVAIPNSGTVKAVGVGIYWNLACTNRTVALDWGAMSPGSQKGLTVYLRNEGNTNATFAKTVRNWVPTTAASYMSLTWNYTNQIASRNQVLPVRLSLSLYTNASAITSFSYEFVITASS